MIGWGIMIKKIGKLKIDVKRLYSFLLLTVVITFLGLTFGRVLNEILLLDFEEENTTVAIESSDEIKSSDDISSSIEQTTQEANSVAVVNDDQAIYIVQLGVFQTYDNLLTLVGDLQQLGYNYGVTKTDGQYSVFSHISGTKEVLKTVEQALTSQNLTYFVKRLEIPTGDLRWEYFLQAVKQIPFEMTSEFIQTFTEDEMHIFGYYMTLSNASFEALANERQKMLLEIYQWLTP